MKFIRTSVKFNFTNLVLFKYTQTTYKLQIVENDLEVILVS